MLELSCQELIQHLYYFLDWLSRYLQLMSLIVIIPLLQLQRLELTALQELLYPLYRLYEPLILLEVYDWLWLILIQHIFQLHPRESRDNFLKA